MFTIEHNDFDLALGFAKLWACKLHSLQILEDKALCPKLTFWERCVCLYDQALLCYCVHSKAHAWLIDTILDVSARVVFSSWFVIG